MLMTLRVINENRQMISAVRSNLEGYSARTAVSMVADYNRVRPQSPGPSAKLATLPDQSLHPCLSVKVDSLTDFQEQMEERKAYESVCIQLSASRRARDLAETRLTACEEEYATRSAAAIDDISQLKAALDVKEATIVSQQAHINDIEARLREIYSSTVWRLLAPLRMLGKARRNIGILKRSLGVVVDHPRSMPRYLRRAGELFRAEGITGVKKAVLRTSMAVKHHDAWDSYRQTFERDVKPKVLARIAEMKCRPLISIIVPTFNTPESMLKEMLGSVMAQHYPNWELCIADDGSDQPHVRNILEEHADSDRRIKLALGSSNQGVSHASNAALMLCSGEFVVLLDHAREHGAGVGFGGGWVGQSRGAP
jgi:hypothetical protein